jgi:AcrR family transcriptional regulator
MSRTAPEPTADAASDPRRRALLTAAVEVFTRYGYRKTSMDEVARAAEISRQGLYLHFPTKEDLFRAALGFALSTSLEGALGRLREPGATLEAQLAGAFDEWVGRYVGKMGAGASDIVEAASTLMGPVIAEHEARFADAVAKVITSGRLAAAYRPAGLSARQLFDVLNATARGLKYGSESREAFGRSMTLAVRAMCAPLLEGR